ncbi:MAG TPA: potassium transporter TrkA [Anaerolineae bacterium]|nr:potassium transporter TrkA [Anaerolineae bacterium]
MKSLPSQFYFFLRDRPARRNIATLLRFVVILTALVTVYSILFHYIMAYEGRSYSWVTGFYWTLTVMSTLGFGDITFESDIGRIFSTVVLLSGMIFLLVLLPFTFIEFFYVPWTKSQAAARAPSELPENTRNHIILTSLEAITRTVIGKLEQYQYEYVVLESDINEALRLNDQGYKVMVGDLDSPATYQKARAQNALMVVTTKNDMINTNVAFTVREFTQDVTVIATANSPASVDILELAGCNHVLQIAEMMGQAMARRVHGSDRLAHLIGNYEKLLFVEATVKNTNLVGKTLRESRLHESMGISVLGHWEAGEVRNVRADTVITSDMVLVMCGMEENIGQFNRFFSHAAASSAPVVILGGGRVGRAAARRLDERGMDFRIVELLEERVKNIEKYVIGNAAELDVLKQAGITEASAVIVTTHDDDTNIYLTLYCRRLRPDIQIISRATRERNVATLQRAGADFIMSYATMGSNAIFNLLDKESVFMVAEGLDVFRVQVASSLEGRTLAESGIREKTGCTVLAIKNGGEIDFDFSPHLRLTSDMDMILIGNVAAEKEFARIYKPSWR